MFCHFLTLVLLDAPADRQQGDHHLVNAMSPLCIGIPYFG
jgi:hypothetical protein